MHRPCRRAAGQDGEHHGRGRELGGQRAHGSLMGAKCSKLSLSSAAAPKNLLSRTRSSSRRPYDDVMRLLRASPVVMGELGLAEYGTSALVDIVDQRRMAPTENFPEDLVSPGPPLFGAGLKKAFGFKRKAAPSVPSSARGRRPAANPSPSTRPCSHFGALTPIPTRNRSSAATSCATTWASTRISTAATIAAYGEARGEFLVSDDILDMVRKIGYREGTGTSWPRARSGTASLSASPGSP